MQTKYDKGIIYNAKLKEIKRNIEKLKNISINMLLIEKTIEEIEKEVEQKINNNYQSFQNNSSLNFLHDSLDETYINATKRLDSLNDILKKEWEDYYRIDTIEKDIKAKIININKNNIDEIVRETSTLLNMMIHSSTINYSMEEQIVLRVFNTVYEVMKLELIFSNNPILLDMIKTDEVASSYTTEFIKRDICKIDDNEQINMIQVNLEKNGLSNYTLLDKTLLKLVTFYTNNEIRQKIIDSFMQTLSSYETVQKEQDKLIKNEEKQTKILELNERELNDCKKRRNKRRRIALINSLIVSVGIVLSSTGAKLLAKDNEYLTTTTTYDSSTDELTTTEDYIKGKNEETTLIEYAPWDTPGLYRKGYSRNVYKYDISKITDYEDLTKYLDESLEEKINYTSTIEKTKTEPDDLDYTTNKYVIQRTTKNLEDYRIKNNLLSWILYSLFFSAGILGVDYAIIKAITNESLKRLKREYESLSNDFQTEKKKKEILKKEIENNIKLLEALKNSLDEQYNSLPESVKEEEEIKEKVKQLLK